MMRTDRLDDPETPGQMKGSPGHKPRQIVLKLIGEDFGRKVVRPTVDNAMTNRLHRRKAFFREGRERLLYRPLLIHYSNCSLCERGPFPVDKPDPAVILTDVFDGPLSQHLLGLTHLEQMELER
jgi:hypothetical protein